MQALSFVLQHFLRVLIFFIFRYLHRWELEAALEVLTVCNCHLLDGDPLKTEVPELAFNLILSEVELILLFLLGGCSIKFDTVLLILYE